MRHEIINIDNDKAIVEAYILDNEISYKTTKQWPALIICPGGGYLTLAKKEGEAIATHFLANGFSCFVLKYSTYVTNRDTMLMEKTVVNSNAYFPVQVLQLMETIHLIKNNSENWGIDINNIFIIGFSAGGHIAGMFANRWNDSSLTSMLSFNPMKDELKIKGCLLCYPMLTGDIESAYVPVKQIELMSECLYGKQCPTEDEKRNLAIKNFVSKESLPTFIWHCLNDIITPSSESSKLILSYQKHNVPCEFHLFMDGNHAMGLANDLYAKTDAEISQSVMMWSELALNWLKTRMKGD